ncbi:MAG: hypothetical protein HQ559_06970 [Lentisphaerae bacterium]|nr:hypothetical protein [Lentisphaerota bacterium]
MNLLTRRIRNLKFYFSLCPDGRRFLREACRKVFKVGQLRIRSEMLERLEDDFGIPRDIWKECVGTCDRAFSEFVPRWYVTQQTRVPPRAVYFRMTKMANFIMEEQLLLLRAYNIQTDHAAGMRLALLSMLKRVYDDLLDEEVFSADELLKPDDDPEKLKNPEFAMYQHLKRLIRELVPENEFPNYYDFLARAHEAYGKSPTPDNVEEVIFEKAECSMLMNAYIMINEPPADYLKGRIAASRYVSVIDDFYDQDEDLAEGRLTYMNQAADPESACREQIDAIHAYLRQHAPNPEPYIRVTTYTSEYLIRSRLDGKGRVHAMIYA